MKINVIKAFKLTHDNGTVEDYGVGMHAVTEATAQHWYTQLHIAVDDDVQKAEEVVVRKAKAK